MAEKKEEKKTTEKTAAAAAPAAAARGAGAETKKAAPAGGGGAGGLLKSTPVLLAVVMLVEGGVLFAGFKLISSGPKGAQGAELSMTDAHGETSAAGGHGGSAAAPKINPKKLLEISILDFKAPNKLTGRTFLYDVSILVSAKSEFKEKLDTAIKDREATIRDRIRTIIAQSDPEKLNGSSEPGLETLKRQVKSQLDEIIGDGMIEEVLVPRCIPYRADF